jgi:hypothetical protein
MQNEWKTCEKFMLFVSQKEEKIIQNGLRFASISHVAKKNLSEKGTPYRGASYVIKQIFILDLLVLGAFCHYCNTCLYFGI